MRGAHLHRPLRCIAAALLCLLGPLGVALAEDQKEVLALYATRRDAQISILGDRDLPRMLREGMGDRVDYYSEFLDLARFQAQDYQPTVRDYLRRKYSAQHFDLVIAMHDEALAFVGHYRDELFPDAAVVFASSRSNTRRLPNSTGVITPWDFARTLTVAARLQPNLRSVVVVTGADPRDVAFEREARMQFEASGDRFAFTYLRGLLTSELEKQLAALPRDAMVYYLLVNSDGSGQRFHPLEYVERVARAASVPVYCWVDSALGRGILGGSLRSQSAQVEAVGAVALRILRGERADDIAVTSPDLNSTEVDWRQLRRWGISEARVPPGTLVQFKEPSLWDSYRVHIIATVGLLLAQSALIAALLAQRARRHRAEARAHASETQLRHSYDRIRDLAARLLGAQDDERARIARELHDDIGQQMALLLINLEVLGGLAEGDSEEIARDAIGRAQTISRGLHDLSHRLHPARLRLSGLVPALQALERGMAGSGSRLVFSYDDVPALLPPDLTICVYRVVQEALQNALKHSRATEVRLHLRGSPGKLAVTITDDGVGFDLDAVSLGVGLESMHERIEAAGGSLDIHSRRGAGTRLEFVVPVVPADAEEDPSRGDPRSQSGASASGHSTLADSA